jgi:hypothetical protein
MRDKIQSFESLKNIHEGERLFIIGTGPSLLKTDVSLIKNEILFGVNSLYRGYEKFDIKCQYYGVSDPKIPYLQDVLNLKTQLFLGHGACDQYLTQYFSREIKVEKFPLLLSLLGWMWESESNFSFDPQHGTFNGDTVVIDICLQVAYYMGFVEIYLLGCDCNYTGMHRFDGSVADNLAGSGVSGNWKKVFSSYKTCKNVFEEDNREIINATVGGKLEIFERRCLEDIIC